jgi:hypothetical protein
MSNNKSAAAPAFATLALSDLATVCGGDGTSPSTSTQSTNVTPNLTCPTGTAPHWESTNGGGGAQGSGGWFSGSANGGGSSQKFWCDVLPTAPTTQPQPPQQAVPPTPPPAQQAPSS